MTNERVLLERALKALEHIGTMGNEEAGNIAAFALTEALDARQKLADEPTGWQPIDTAPKDGTKILLGYFPGDHIHDKPTCK